jgi:hypothetical protein
MKRTKLLVAVFAIATFSVFAAMAQKVSIDFRYNVGTSDPAKDYFKWNAPGEKAVTDKFDANKADEEHGTTGASVLGTTAKFDAVRYDSADTATRKLALTNGLRGLFLYPISSRATATDDDLKVTTSGKDITIRYVHRGTAYELVAPGGKLDVAKDCKIGRSLADNVGGAFVLKDEYLKAGGDPNKMSDLDWSKVTLDPEVADSAKKWTGVLTVAYKGGVLTIKGTLNPTK